MSSSEEQTKNSAELLRAALATADLSQPVRFFNGETGGFVLQTAKGENTPARISEQSLDEMTAYFEEILSVLDKEVALADDEDGTAVDLLTAPAWFGPYKYMDAFYVMDDLSFQLDPNRSKTLIEPIYNILTQPPTDYAIDSPNILGLKAVLDGECSQGLSCVYRMLYPEVKRAGPVALSPCAIALLTHGIHVIAAANQSALVEILSAVTSVLVPANNGESKTDDASQFNSGRKSSPILPDHCICCLLAKQARSYVDASKEVAYSENRDGLLTATTFIGIMKTNMGVEGNLKAEVDFFAPTVNIHDGQRCYLADKSPFCEYRLVRRERENRDPLWVVVRSASDDTTPNKLHAAVGVSDQISPI